MPRKKQIKPDEEYPPAPAGFEYADDMTSSAEYQLDGWQRLANAIVLQAYYDYVSAVFYGNDGSGGGYHARTTVESEEAFFYSPMFKVLTNVNPDWLIAHAHKKVAEWKRKAREVLLTDYVSGKENKGYNAAFNCPICSYRTYVRYPKGKQERRCLCNYCRIAMTKSEAKAYGENA